MNIDNQLKNCNMTIDGRGYAGRLKTVTPPKLTMKTEEFRGGGMDAPIEIDMGMEKLELSATLGSVDPELLKSWGLTQGASPSITIRGALESEFGAAARVEIRCSGKIAEVDHGDWKPGDPAELKFRQSVTRYEYRHNGELLHKIDVQNMIRIVNGVDQLAEQRAALGV